MAHRRRRSGDLEWIGFTGAANKPAGSNTSIALGVVAKPAENYSDTFQAIPPGTMLRTMGSIAVYNPNLQGASVNYFVHPMAALHHDEAVKDDAGTLNWEVVGITDPDNLGFEGLFWLGSCILWEAYSVDAVGDAKPGCSIRVDSKAKRILEYNDILALDLGEVTEQRALAYSWDLRVLLKHA